MKEPKFFACAACGVVVEEIEGSASEYQCEGRPLALLQPGESDGAQEKHAPRCVQSGRQVTVSVGSMAHPMSVEHGIRWVALHTARGMQRASLRPDDPPEAVFWLSEGEAPVAAYAYCNLHGLWRTDF